MFDHELKFQRAFQHLQNLNPIIEDWLNDGNYTVRYEFDPDASWNGPVPPGNTNPAFATYHLASPVYLTDDPRILPEGVAYGEGLLVAYATTQQPPKDPISLIIGEILHNLRSGLDALAYALTVAYLGRTGGQVTDEIERSSEFPIFGDEDRRGNTGVGSAMFHRTQSKGGRKGLPAPGSGLSKIQSWSSLAQAVGERLQPYNRPDFRSDPLWVLHELEVANKHRVLHTAVMAFSGTLWDPYRFENIYCIGPGFIESRAGVVESDTPISRVYGVHRVDPERDVKVEIHPAVDIVFGDGTPSVEN